MQIFFFQYFSCTAFTKFINDGNQNNIIQIPANLKQQKKKNKNQDRSL